MRLSAYPLINVSGVNSFEYSQRMEYTAGDPVDFYFQLVDLDRSQCQYGWQPGGMRYMPLNTTTPAVTVMFTNINDAKQITRSATMPFVQDSSIWKVSILGSDPIRGTVSIKVTLTENSGTSESPSLVTKTFSLKGVIGAKVI